MIIVKHVNQVFHVFVIVIFVIVIVIFVIVIVIIFSFFSLLQVAVHTYIGERKLAKVVALKQYTKALLEQVFIIIMVVDQSIFAYRTSLNMRFKSKLIKINLGFIVPNMNHETKYLLLKHMISMLHVLFATLKR